MLLELQQELLAAMRLVVGCPDRKRDMNSERIAVAVQNSLDRHPRQSEVESTSAAIDRNHLVVHTANPAVAGSRTGRHISTNSSENEKQMGA